MDQLGDSSQGRRLHTGFLKSARLYPGCPALSVGADVWTYAEVEDKARRWAAAILGSGGGPVKRVGVFAYRSEVSYVGVLASLLAGAAFVPLNRTFPLQRTRSMLERADVDVLLVDEGSLPQLPVLLEGLPRRPAVLLPKNSASEARVGRGSRLVDGAELNRTPALATLPPVAADDPAYLLFTSGSTGQPKGVLISHANVTHFLHVNQRRYQITPDDRLSQTFDQTFDLSVFDLFMAWGGGACVCTLQPLQLLAPFSFIQEKGITVWFSVPSVVAFLRKKNLLKPNSLPTLRWSLFCGEALPRATAEAWQAAAPNSALENLYGPTELTIACLAYRWDRERSPGECFNEVVAIGRAYEGLHALVVDEELQPVAPGVSGELCVAGPQTFPGYWRDPAATAERCFTRTDAHGVSLKYYRTGDCVRLTEHGNYVYIGRTDQQVKVLGYRVELGEVEAALRRQSSVVEAAAFGWPVEEGTAQGIISFVSGNGINVETLAASLRERLPAYMVPRSIYVLDSMPLNANGKVDRNALRQTLSVGV